MKSKISKAAKKIESLAVRARANVSATSRIANCKVECYAAEISVRSHRTNYAVRRHWRVYFYLDGVRISRFDLLAYLDEALSV